MFQPREMTPREVEILETAGQEERDDNWAGAGFSRRNAESSDEPKCDMNMPHFFGPDGVVGCPPNCPGNGERQ